MQEKQEQSTEAASNVASQSELDQLASEAGAVDQAASTAPAAAPTMPTSEMLKPVISVGFLVLAPAWNVTDAEVHALATVYGNLLDKYFPGGVLNEFGVELTAIATTVAIFMPRMTLPRKVVPPKVDTTQENGAEIKQAA